jgi:hypothetical protein
MAGGIVLTVKGVYDGNTIHFDNSSIPVGQCDVIITFLPEENNAAQFSGREEYNKGYVPQAHDSKKEFSEYTDQPYDQTHSQKSYWASWLASRLWSLARSSLQIFLH